MFGTNDLRNATRHGVTLRVKRFKDNPNRGRFGSICETHKISESTLRRVRLQLYTCVVIVCVCHFARSGVATNKVGVHARAMPAVLLMP